MEKNSITFVQLLKFFRSKRVTLSCYNVRIRPVFVFPDPGPLLGTQARTISSKTSHTDIHKIQRCQSNTSSCRQYCSLKIVDENGRYSKSENGRVGQGNLGISFEVGDHNYCRIPPKRIEFNSRLGISKHFGLLRVDAESSSSPNKGFSRDRFVCIPSITSDTNLCCMETRNTVM